MNQAHHADPDAHTPFFDSSLVALPAWMVLNQAEQVLTSAGLWSEKLAHGVEELRQSVAHADALTRLARAVLLGGWPAHRTLELALAGAASTVEPGSVHEHGRKEHLKGRAPTRVTHHPEHGDGHEHPEHGKPSHEAHDNEARHVLRTGPALDLLLAAAALGGTNETARLQHVDAAIALLAGPSGRMADLLAAATTSAADAPVIAAALNAVLNSKVPAGRLASGVWCQASAGRTSVDWLAWSAAMEALRAAFIEGKDPIAVLLARSAVPELDEKIQRISPMEIFEPALDGPPSLVTVEGRFPAKQPRGIKVSIGHQPAAILRWSTCAVQLAVPRNALGGPVHFVRARDTETDKAVRKAGADVAARLPHGASGSLFSRADWASLSVLSSLSRHECHVVVKHHPRLLRFEVTDTAGKLLASADHLRRKGEQRPKPSLPPVELGSRLKVRWKVLPFDAADARPTVNFGPGQRKHLVPIDGEVDLVMPLDGIDLRLDIPGIGPLHLELPPLITVRVPRVLCVRPPFPTDASDVVEDLGKELTVTLPAGVTLPATVEVDTRATGGRVTVNRGPHASMTLAPAVTSATFTVHVTPTIRGTVPSRVCPGHPEEDQLVQGWPDDPPNEQFDITIRTSTDRFSIDRTVTVHVERPGGRWRQGMCLELVAIHASLLPDGRVLFFGYDEGGEVVQRRNRLGHGHAQVWTPNEVRPRFDLSYNPFCAGHSLRGDGSLVVAGGHAADQGGGDSIALAAVGSFFFILFGAAAFFPQGAGNGDSKRVHIVRNTAGDPTWTELNQMSGARWYPTVITLANGEAQIIGGSAPFFDNAWHRVNEDLELVTTDGRVVDRDLDYPPSARFERRGDGDQRQLASSREGRVATLYNLAQLLPSSDPEHPGHLLLVADAMAYAYDARANALVGERIDLGGIRTWFTQGSSVLLPIDVLDGAGPPEVFVVVVGGGQFGRGDMLAGANDLDPALQVATLLAWDVERRALRRVRDIPLIRRRFMGDSVLLPDGSVLVVNGSETGWANVNSDPATRPERLTVVPPFPIPLIGWGVGDFHIRVDQMEDAVIPRGYHSTALLIPDGRVIVAGSTGGYSGTGDLHAEDFRVQLFEPPYFSCGPRPVILAAPGVIHYGQEFSVLTEVDELERYLVLVRCSSTTHSLNTDQRLLRLWSPDFFDFTPRVTDRLGARMVYNPSYAPPGMYMLFVERKGGIPSEGRLVRVEVAG